MNDFIVVYGDVVSNISIEPALREHQARRVTDKNAFMTMVLRQGGKTTHSGGPFTPIFVTDPSKKRCLQYEQISAKYKAHSMLLDEDIWQSGAEELEIRHDLVDCGIDICTPEVLALWSDNFDYEEPRRNFLHSVLKDYELNGKTIHIFIEKEGYANRVRNLRRYDRVSRDVLARYTWPMCPDGTFAGEYGCRMQRGGVFREEGVKVSKRAIIGKRTLLGKGATIGANTKIESSVIGRDCKIGKNCVIEEAYLWDGVEVQDDTYIRRAIIANKAIIGANSKLREGLLIGHGLHLPEGMTTRPKSIIIRRAESPDPMPEDYGTSSSSEDEDGIAERDLARRVSKLHLAPSSDSISTLTSSRSASPEPTHHRTTSITSLGSNISDQHSNATSADGASSSDFHKEASVSILDALINNDDPANIQIELQGLRMASNASEHAVRKAVVSGLVDYVLQQRASGANTKVAQILEKNGELVRRVVTDSTADQADFLLLVQQKLVGQKDAEVNMLSLCNALYGEDLVEGEAVVQWWEDERGVKGEGMKAVRSHKDMEKLVEIARDEDEESDEEPDDDGDDDE